MTGLTGWRVHEDTTGPVHVWPRSDVTEHDVDSLDCVRGPTIDWSTNVPLVSHHSLDGREDRE